MSYFRRRVGRLLRGTDVRINGNRPWDIRVHDIGCGWGGTAEYMAQRYGCERPGTCSIPEG